MSFRTFLPILPLVLAAAPAGAGGSDDPAQRPPEAGEDAGEAVEAVRRGDFREARAILAGLIVSENVAEASRLVAEGAAAEALVLLDEALELAPRDADLLYRRAAAAYAAGDALVAAGRGGNPELFYRDALDHYLESLQAGRGIEAAFQASRAARRIPDPDQALRLVRESVATLDERGQPLPAVSPPVERIWAEAAFDVYLDRVRAEQDGEEYFLETERQLERLLGRTPIDPWPRMQLANLYQWAGEVERAVRQIELALEVAPDDQALHDRLMGLVPAELGHGALVDFYTDFARRFPSARSVRNLGVATFYAALDRFERGEHDADAFRAAEEHFRRAGEMDAAWSTDCLGYEAVARNAIGWCHYHAGEYSAAKEAFLSMEDLFEGALAWSLPERLPDGIAGLGSVVGRLIEDPLAIESLDSMVEAAAITDFLHAYRPDDGNLANDAGFVNRDTAVLFERKSLIVRREAAALDDPRAKSARLAEADRLMARAQELMERSWSAYQVAARLRSDDVRVVNDAGLVMTYYLRTDPEAAEGYLLRAVELGREQLQDPHLDEDERYNLNEAWGDAHQNLAILELTIRKNPAKAREWLAKSLEIGPASREDQMRGLLTLIDRRIAGEDVDLGKALGGMVWPDHPGR